MLSKTGLCEKSTGIGFHGFPDSSVGKESACNAGDLGLIPGLGRSPEEGKGYPTPVFWHREFHGLYLYGSQKVGHSWVNFTFTFHTKTLKIASFNECKRLGSMQVSPILFQFRKWMLVPGVGAKLRSILIYPPPSPYSHLWLLGTKYVLSVSQWLIIYGFLNLMANSLLRPCRSAM